MSIDLVLSDAVSVIGNALLARFGYVARLYHNPTENRIPQGKRVRSIN